MQVHDYEAKSSISNTNVQYVPNVPECLGRWHFLARARTHATP